MYSYSSVHVLAAMKGLSGLERLTFHDPIGVQTALMAFEHGLSFTDAVHLAQAHAAQGFATFDRDVVKRAAKLKGVVPVFAPNMLEGKR